MPGTSRRTPSTKASKKPPTAGQDGPAPAPAEEPSPERTVATPPTRTAEPEPDPDTVVVKLPFLTVSLSRPAARPVEASGSAAPAEHVSAAGSSGVQRLLFYGGVAALGVVGAVEWPVAAAIAAGTYVASRTRALGRPPGE